MSGELDELVTDNREAHRYEVHIGEELAALTTYRLEPNDTEPARIVLLHTETRDAFAGHGVASRLARTVLDDARGRGLRVVPECPYVAHYIAEHPEYQDLVA